MKRKTWAFDYDDEDEHVEEACRVEADDDGDDVPTMVVRIDEHCCCMGASCDTGACCIHLLDSNNHNQYCPF